MKLLARQSLFLLFGLLLVACSGHAKEDVTFGSATISIDGETYEVEFAESYAQRARGLMFRESLCDDCGMLFHFDPAKRASMWMKNTYIPLDVAYIDKDGIITDIKPLQPQDLTSVGASTVVPYALEMNQGWFEKQGISEGDRIVINHQ